MHIPFSFARVFVTALLFICFSKLQAQAPDPTRIYFKPGLPSGSLRLKEIDPKENLFRSSVSNGQTWVFLQFSKIPTPAKKNVLKARGIELLEYIPENTFLAIVKGKFGEAALKEMDIIATIPFTPAFKKSVTTDYGYARTTGPVTGSMNYHVRIAPGYDSNQVRSKITTALSALSINAGTIYFMTPQLLEMNLSNAALETIIKLPFILYAMPAPTLSVLNSDVTDVLRADIVQNGFNGLPGLSGKNIVVGMGDVGSIYHIDNRYYEEGQSYAGQSHATHVAGTLAGAGIVNPAMKGFAFESTLIVDYFNNIINNTPALYANKRMVLTNNSYGAGSSCLPYSGQYSGYCVQGDQQSLDFPHLLHVFAAGNSGDLKCGNFAEGYRTIDNAFQAGKNVITVGGNSKDASFNSFSKGPTLDGRIKPELTAIGFGVISTVPNNTYGTNWGSSMACPQVTGTLALMYERYRQLNNNQDPPGDLMKAAICNTATDIGTKGVDFTNGFGWVNAKDAVELISNRTYFAGSLEQDQELQFEILLDKEVFDFRIMLYWHDRPSSLYSEKNLVNDLDISVLLPDGSTYDPMVLDTSAAGFLNPAVRGKDHINNIEQVVIDHAMPGRYAVKIKGYKIPFGPQSFKIVYNWKQPSLKMLQPAGGELWKPGQVKGIQWQDPGRSNDIYQFDYSVDDGNNWVNLPGQTGTYNRKPFAVPSFFSTNARIRITNTITSEVQVSNSFRILPDISFSLSSSCESTVLVKWTKPAGIDSVIVVRYIDGAYAQEAITSDSSWLITGLRKGITYWITLQPVLNGKTGERSVAKKINTRTVACPPQGASGDIGITGISLPATAREGTGTALTTSNSFLQVVLENNGKIAIADSIFLSLEKNGVLAGKDTLVKSIAAGAKFNWLTRLKVIAYPGETVLLNATVFKKADPVSANNQRDTVFRYLSNPVLQLPYTEDFSSVEDTGYSNPGYTGLTGATAWDLIVPSFSTKLLTRNSAADKGMLVTTKLDRQNLQLIATYNLSTYQLKDNIRVALKIPDFDNLLVGCFARGNDSATWLPVPITDSVTNLPKMSSLDISGTLEKGNQQFSSSFQFRISVLDTYFQHEFRLMESFQLFSARADISLIEFSTDKIYVTDGDSVHLEVTAKNNNLTGTDAFDINLVAPDGIEHTAKIDSLGAGKTTKKSFPVSVQDWPETEAWVTAWISHSENADHTSDSIQQVLQYAKKINQYPYLEGFENGKAGWGSTYLFELSSRLGESIAAYHPANGKQFWGTNWIANSSGIGYLVPSGKLESPVFDIRELHSPYISMSVNKQLCDGKDSVFLEISSDTGKTWNRFIPLNSTFNWYDSLSGNSWKDCGQNYWQVISAPLPTINPSLRLRFVSLPRTDLAYELPRLPGGMLVDDIHVFDFRFPIYNKSGAINKTGTIDNAGFNFITEADQVLGAIQSDLAGQYTLKMPSAIDEKRLYGNRVLPRNWIFTGTPANNEQNKLRLYFTEAEARTFLRSVPCDTCKQIRSAYDLSVFRYSGPFQTINERDYDNIPGFDQVWNPEEFDLVPYESGYYAEIPAAAYGEFYIGLNDADNAIQLKASRQQGAEAVILDWTVSNTDSVSRYEIERAARQQNGQLVFEKIGTTLQLGAANTFRHRDQQIKPPVAYYYRIKLIYNSGEFRYSTVKTISFESEIRAKLYPNPSAGEEVKLLLENVEGKKLHLVLYDQAGRYLWEKQLEPASTQQQIIVSGAGKRLSAGVYYLKISADGQKKTFRLVITRN
jgi:subtilisin family serine protease